MNEQQIRQRSSHAFRFECEVDLGHLLVAAQNQCGQFFRLVAVAPELQHDTMHHHVYVDSDLTLEGIRNLMRTVPDGHVMVQTVAFVDEYTGVRDFGVPTNVATD